MSSSSNCRTEPASRGDHAQRPLGVHQRAATRLRTRPGGRCGLLEPLVQEGVLDEARARFQ